MKIKLDQFQGLLPIVDPRKLGPYQAQTAQNVALINGTLTPIKEPGQVQALTDATQISVYLYNGSWLQWTTDVDVVKSPIDNDQYSRIYYTGDDHPKVRGTVAAVQSEYALGIPKPVTAITAAAADKGVITWTQRSSTTGADGTWGYQYEEPDGTVSQSGILTVGVEVTEVTPGSSYT